MYQLDNTRITKEFLLEKNTPETYMEYYLGVPVKKGLFCSPAIIRNDSKPTCSFYKNKRGDLIYKDFAGPSFDFVGAAARRSIASDAGTLYACRIAVLPSRASPAPTKVGAVPGSLWLQGMGS